MNTKLEEWNWQLEIMADLKHNYPEHNIGVLQALIDIIKYRIELEEEQIVKE